MNRIAPIFLTLIFLAGPTFAEEIDFARDIRPIFAEKCMLCHGPDDKKGGLRLTGLDFAQRKLESGRVAIVPGQPKESALIKRIHATDPHDIMPPPGKAEPLTTEEKDLLEQWIASGAEWPIHWAYAPLTSPEPPKIDTHAWVKNPIDAFVMAALEKERITPSEEADTITLIRRFFYDLVGLPPSLEQVDHYQNTLINDRERGLSEMVDDLLAIEHFGERWGRHWLDKARYADSDGYEKDNGRPDAWKFRDWVIDAINHDMPVDAFTIEQFAGDLLEPPKPSQILATAFNRQTLTNTEGGTDQEQWRVAAVMDRVETMGAAWMGLTLTCARCHTHKFDEITHHEYYQLFAYFNNGDESKTKVPTSKQAWADYETAQTTHEAEIAGLRQRVAAVRETLPERLPAWETSMARSLKEVTEPAFELIVFDDLSGPEGVTFEAQSDGIHKVNGKNPNKGTYALKGQLPTGWVTGLKLEVLPEGEGGPGRTKHGNFVLNEIRLAIDDEPQVFAAADADHSQDKYPVADAISGGNGGWAIGSQLGMPHHAVFGLARPFKASEPNRFHLELVQNHGTQHTLGKFRVTALTTPTSLIVPKSLHPILAKTTTARTDAERDLLLIHFEKVDSESRHLIAELETAESKAPAKPEMDVRVLRERKDKRRATHVFRRGEFKQPTDEVRPNTLATLPPITHRAGSEGDRLDLARWLVNGENPLTPRVLVNHAWSHLFGEGLVTTLNDFGVRGGRPSHPELLDWLAAEFVANGWSRKKLIKTIVLSNTYRQSSHHRPELLDIDPKNHLLARQNRFRVEAEIVRDLSLSVAGLLADDVGGPSVFPPIPSGVSDVNYNSAFKWKVSEGRNKYRRGMYTYFKRTAPHPNLTTFDCPDSNVTCVQRTRSNTPLAALITLNNDTFTEAARALAVRVYDPQRSDQEQMIHAFRLCLSRSPDDTERLRLMTLLETARSWYQDHPKDAETLFKDRPELASLTATVRVLLNLDEFLTRN